MPQGIGYDDPQGRTPRKPEGSIGVPIDNFLRSLFGGDPRTQAEGGEPTDILGVLPQSPTQGSPASGQGLGIQADPSYGVVGGGGLSPLQDYGTGEGTPVPPVPPVPMENMIPNVQGGDPFTEADNPPVDPIQEAVIKAQVTGRPDARAVDTFTPDDALSGAGWAFNEGDELSHLGARNVAGGIGAVAGLPAIGAGGGGALLRWIMSKLGAGGRGVADAAKTGLNIAQRNPATAAAVGTAGVSPILNELLQRPQAKAQPRVEDTYVGGG